MFSALNAAVVFISANISLSFYTHLSAYFTLSIPFFDIIALINLLFPSSYAKFEFYKPFFCIHFGWYKGETGFFTLAQESSDFFLVEQKFAGSIWIIGWNRPRVCVGRYMCVEQECFFVFDGHIRSFEADVALFG